MTATRPVHAASPAAAACACARVLLVATLACVVLPLGGCAVAAFPCRVASATLKIVPVVGHPAAVPFDTCADAID